MSNSAGQSIVVGLGEALFDVFADRRVAGGAPLNVAVHAQQAGRLLGHPVSGVVASRIGHDDAGIELMGILKRFGVNASVMQVDQELPTGRVLVTVDANGSPTYDIEHPSAWDAFNADDHTWQTLASVCHAVCFGTLAQRDARSREAIQRFVQAAPQAIRLLDVNLRQTFHNAETLRKSLELSSMIKTNEEEAPTVAEYAGLPALKSDAAEDALPWAQTCMERYDLDAVILTRGARGTLICRRDGVYERDASTLPVMERYPPDSNADAVGAGDACAAGVLVGTLANLPPQQLVQLCDNLGGYVAGRPGATPELPGDLLA